jgi:outer membrane biogenesis lipoprotein LolB
MRRLALLSGVAVLLLSASVALAATPNGPKPGWEARSGVFKTAAAANAHITALTAKGRTGYSVETEKSGAAKVTRYEVEKEFATQKLATAEVKLLHKADFKGDVEYSPGTK